MWDEIIIKTKNGFQETGITTIQIPLTGNRGISENLRCYRISIYQPFELGLTIFKDTKEGIQLTKMIEEKETIEYIENKIIKWYLKRVSPNSLFEKIQDIAEQKFQEGRESKTEEFKACLGIDRL